MSLIVTKFGGSVFTSDDAYRTVAAHLDELSGQYNHVVAVVSARKGASDALIAEVGGDYTEQLGRALKGEITLDSHNTPDVARRLIEGEFRSVDALIGASGGRYQGLRQTDPPFPIAGNHSYLSGTVLEDVSRARAADHELPQGVTIVAGYGARDPKGDVALLGRNASDLVAAWFAALYGADTLRYYKDVEGVFEHFGTPNQRLIDRISRDELATMGPLKVLDNRVLDVPYNGNIEIMQFGGNQPGTVITPYQQQERRVA